jgi:16S rRNA (cytosine967-C5)-methyltransferase
MAEPRPRGKQPAAAAGGRGGGTRHIEVDASRLAAFDVLKTVRVDKAYTNLVLPAAIAHYKLSGRDAAFTTELASGTIRLRGTYDAIIASCSDRPMTKIEARVLDALRLGAHQLLSMRVPSHAAISTTVDIVHLRTGSGAAGFANAVLRRVSEHDLDAWIALVAPDSKTSPTRHDAIAYSHPEWVVDELRGAVGKAELADLLAADNVAPAVTLVVRPGRSTRDELPGEPTPYSPYGVVMAGGDPGAVPAVAEGRAGVQDEGSQLVATVLADAPLEGPDRRWLDLCAGPGGKSALMAGLAAERGATLVANELQPHRTGLVARALRGTDGTAAVVTADGTRPPYRPGSFDRVLVDAPCTGLGALRRRPEARWARKPDDLLTLVMLQRSLTRAALDLVRPGGVLLYATCSPVFSETATVVSAIAQTRRDVVLEDAAPLLSQVPDCAGPVPGTLQLWPHRHGTDAMFMALFRRVGV